MRFCIHTNPRAAVCSSSPSAFKIPAEPTRGCRRQQTRPRSRHSSRHDCFGTVAGAALQRIMFGICVRHFTPTVCVVYRVYFPAIFSSFLHLTALSRRKWKTKFSNLPVHLPRSPASRVTASCNPRGQFAGEVIKWKNAAAQQEAAASEATSAASAAAAATADVQRQLAIMCGV
jgi:hypothetical protein